MGPAKPSIPSNGTCAICKKTAAWNKPLIHTCCCERRWLHAHCFREEKLSSWRAHMSERTHMPLTGLLDCPHCGSAYRYRYQSRILRFAVEHVPSWAWPILIIFLYLLAFIFFCELYAYLDDNA